MCAVGKFHGIEEVMTVQIGVWLSMAVAVSIARP